MGVSISRPTPPPAAPQDPSGHPVPCLGHLHILGSHTSGAGGATHGTYPPNMDTPFTGPSPVGQSGPAGTLGHAGGSGGERHGVGTHEGGPGSSGGTGAGVGEWLMGGKRRHTVEPKGSAGDREGAAGGPACPAPDRRDSGSAAGRGSTSVGPPHPPYRVSGSDQVMLSSCQDSAQLDGPNRTSDPSDMPSSSVFDGDTATGMLLELQERAFLVETEVEGCGDEGYVTDVVAVGAGIHSVTALLKIFDLNPALSMLLIEQNSGFGGMFSRLRWDYELAAVPDMRAFGFAAGIRGQGSKPPTCEDLCRWLECGLVSSPVRPLLNRRVMSVEPSPDPARGRYLIRLDTGPEIYTNAVIVGTGFESVKDTRFDEETKRLLLEHPSTIQTCDTLMWEVGRATRSDKRAKGRTGFSMNYKRFAVIGAGPGGEDAITEIMHLNQGPCEIFWVQGRGCSRFNVHKEGTILHSVDGYASSIRRDAAGAYTIDVADSVLESIDFVVIATGFEKVLRNRILANFSATTMESVAEAMGQAGQADAAVTVEASRVTSEDIYFVGAAMKIDRVMPLLPHTMQVAECVAAAAATASGF